MSEIPAIVYVESTPNPECIKFVLNRFIVEPDRIVEYTHAEECLGSPLAMELFSKFPVKSLFFSNNFITITKRDHVNWQDTSGFIREFLKGYFSQGLPVIESYPETFDNPGNQQAETNKTGNIEDAIIRILDEYIKPAVEQDGGAIVFKSYDDGKVKLALQGSCSGCPSASITLKAGIENLLKRMIPEVTEVVAEEI